MNGNSVFVRVVRWLDIIYDGLEGDSVIFSFELESKLESKAFTRLTLLINLLTGSVVLSKFFSVDGRFRAYHSPQRLKKTELTNAHKNTFHG